MARTDPCFNLPAPLVFAHRGGASEAPESTISGFLHALRHRADVLEVDVQMTRDGVPVVWHGPELDIVFDREGNCLALPGRCRSERARNRHNVC